jgi:type IV pilus assembly protein PilY1
MNGYTDVDFDVTTWENRIPANDRADNNNSTCFSNTYKCPPTSTTSCSTNSEKVEAVAYYMHATDLRSDKEGTQNITLFPVYAFGDGSGTKTLQMAAKYGGYNNKNGNLPSPNTWTSPDDRTEWDTDNDCKPDNYFEADDGAVLESNIMTAMSSILAKVASGTAASILSNSEGSGANLLQAVFYPSKIFPGPTLTDAATEASWIGELQNLWYYVDPFIANSTVREDTDFSTTTPNHILDLKKDYVTRFFFLNGETKVELKRDTNGDGLGEDPPVAESMDPDEVKSLWRAGRQLWARTADSRTIHTSVDGYSLLEPTTGSPPRGGFYAPSLASTRLASVRPYLQAADNDGGSEAKKIIDYIRGTDQTGYRNRSVSLAVSGATVTQEWKLGDIVSSTPKLQSTNKLNTYNMATPAGYNDKSYDKFVNLPNYSNRGMVYVGANDGMLHAFKLGKLTVADGADTGITSGGSAVKIAGFVKATLTNATSPTTNAGLGEEQWAYIPRSALPYLKYYTDAVNYKHIFYLDGPTVLSDISVAKTGTCSTDYSLCPKDESGGTNWKTVLIGSMGLGGASRLSTNACLTAATGGTCVKTPIFDPDDTASPQTKGVGYSSYFALDVTDQYFDSTTGALANQPVLKWEFPPRDAADNFGLGYATSGAAIIRIAAKLPADANGVIKQDPTKNGKWFAVFASGPTGPIDTSVHRFMGRSDQNLKLFVVDLGATVDAAHPFVLNTNYWVIDTGITEAFGGSLVSGAIDTDRWSSGSDGNYQDDVVYVGYTKKRTESIGVYSWTDGGVGRLLTKESTNPSDWTFSKVIDGIGPVTTGISRLQDRTNKKLWLYFGTGRFFYTGDDSLSASYNQRYLMGVQDLCYTTSNKIDPACSINQMTISNLKNQTTSISTALDPLTEKGWYVALDAKDDTNGLGAERSITDSVALTNGGVFYTTFKPTTDVCKYGGYSYVWGFNYATGGAAVPAALTGKVLVQVSTGAFEEISLNTALTGSSGRKMGTPMVGKPPADAPPIVSNASNKPPKKILHLQEK